MSDAQKKPFVEDAKERTKTVQAAKKAILGSHVVAELPDQPAEPELEVPMPALAWEGGTLRAVSFLGQGAYGRVWKVKDASGQSFAAKLVHDDFRDVQVECSFLKQLRHCNILICHSMMADTVNVGMLLELGRGSLSEWLALHQLCWPPNAATRAAYDNLLLTRWRFAFQLARGMAHCHAKQVLHCDCKPNNIVLSLDESHIKIADFGLAMRLVDGKAQAVGTQVYTQGYRPPECRPMKVTLAASADCFAIGCVVFAIMCREGRAGCSHLFPPAEALAPEGLPAYRDQKLKVRMNHLPPAHRLITGLTCVDPRSRTDMLAMMSVCSAQLHVDR